MKNHQIMGSNKKNTVLTLIGIIVMILLTVTKVVPSSTIAGYGVFVGIAFSLLQKLSPKHKTPNQACVSIQLWRISKSRA